MCASTVVLFDHECFDSIVRGPDVQYVSFSDALRDGAEAHGLECVNGLEYVDDPTTLMVSRVCAYAVGSVSMDADNIMPINNFFTITSKNGLDWVFDPE